AAGGVDAGDGGGGLFAAERGELVGKQVFQALGAGGEEIHGGRLQVGRVLTRRGQSARAAGRDPPYGNDGGSGPALQGREEFGEGVGGGLDVAFEAVGVADQQQAGAALPGPFDDA